MHPFGLQAVTPTRLVRHAPEAPGLRWLGLGPGFRPSRALLKLQRLFDRHTSWARGRSFPQLRRLLEVSDVGVSLWGDKYLVAFRRATSDELSRALPDARVERMHLVTANSAGFYRQLGSRDADPQQLLVLKR